jgi:head-tail adaptor
MSLTKLLNQPLELHKNSTATTDEYGNQVDTDFTVSTIYGFLQQKDSVETLNDRDTVVSSWECWLPAGTNINAFDRIVFNAQTFEVDGAPWSAYNPRVQSVSHIVCKLKVVL